MISALNIEHLSQENFSPNQLDEYYQQIIQTSQTLHPEGFSQMH